MQLKWLFITFLCSAANAVCDKEIQIYFNIIFIRMHYSLYCWHDSWWLFSSSSTPQNWNPNSRFYTGATSAVSCCAFAPWGGGCLDELGLAGFWKSSFKTECMHVAKRRGDTIFIIYKENHLCFGSRSRSFICFRIRGAKTTAGPIIITHTKFSGSSCGYANEDSVVSTRNLCCWLCRVPVKRQAHGCSSSASAKFILD